MFCGIFLGENKFEKVWGEKRELIKSLRKLWDFLRAACRVVAGRLFCICKTCERWQSYSLIGDVCAR